MFMKALSILLLFCTITFNVNASPDTIKLGIYLKTLYDFNSNAFNYDIDLWMWYKYKNKDLTPLSTIEIVNAKNFEYSGTRIEQNGDIYWAGQFAKANVNQVWDVQNYPFDKQKLELVLEESEFGPDKIVLESEDTKIMYNKDLDLNGWKIDKTSITNGIEVYETDFGDPKLEDKSEFSKVTYTLNLSRDSWSLFLKLFIGCFVAFFVAYLSLFIKPIHVDPRFGLSIGALFAAVGNKYVVDSITPSSVYFTLIDKIHGLTIVYILLLVLLSIISLKLFERDLIQKQRRFDYISAIVVLISFFTFITIIIYNANQH
jgi:hypothetical protein